MDAQQLRQLYDKVTTFLHSCGGIYTAPADSSYINILDSLSHGRYVLDQDGDTIAACLFYMRVQPEDVEGVKHGIFPADKDTGEVVYISEGAGTREGRKRCVEELKQRYGGASVCWHNKYVQPHRFRFYRRGACPNSAD